LQAVVGDLPDAIEQVGQRKIKLFLLALEDYQGKMVV
jgi:hypothetical protein